MIDTMHVKRPKKYFIILTKNQNWDIEEILAMNDFTNYSKLEQLVSELDLRKLSHRMLIDDWEVTKKWVNNRGNFQLNHGSNHLDMQDNTKITGMNVARDHVRPKNIIPGLDGDVNMEDTLLRMQVVVTRVFDQIAIIFDKEPVYCVLTAILLNGFWWIGSLPAFLRMYFGLKLYTEELIQITIDVSRSMIAKNKINLSERYRWTRDGNPPGHLTPWQSANQ